MRFGRRSLFLTAGSLAVALCTAGPAFAQAAPNPTLVVYKGDKGPGAGKHIVFIAGDHEYRSEETLPMLARIMARHYGFTCSVFFTTDPQTGEIDPESSHITGLAALDNADLLVIFTRFKDFPDAEMKHVVDYLNRGGAVVGPRRLDEEAAWIERYRQRWDARFDELDKVVEELKRKETFDGRRKRK